MQLATADPRLVAAAVSAVSENEDPSLLVAVAPAVLTQARHYHLVAYAVA